jgi:hypothetical protein
MYAVNKNTEHLMVATGWGNVEVNIEETNYMFMSCQQNAGQNLDLKIANELVESVL